MGKEKQRIALIALAGVVLVALIGYLGIYQTFGKIAETQGKIKQKEEEIRGYEDKIAQIPQLQAQMEAIQTVVEDFAKILPDDAMDEHFALLTKIDEYKNETQMTLIRFDPVERGKRKRAPGQQESDFIQQQFKLEVEGHFFDIARLLNLIEKTEKFLRIDSFRLYRPEVHERKEKDLTYLKADVTMSTFTYSRSEKPAAAPPQ